MVIVLFTLKRHLRGLKEPTLSGHTLQLPTMVKYLGLILDKGLTWKGTFGKTWGLKPQVLHWIYTMVIRNILTYRSVVWWPWVR
jgi:hypothetical protein